MAQAPVRQRKESPLVVFVTTGSPEEARMIGANLVKRRLAACATVVGFVESLYRWKGKLERSTETLLVIKTTEGCYPRLEQMVRKQHSYEVPEIIALPIVAGSEPYLQWLRQQTGRAKK